MSRQDACLFRQTWIKASHCRSPRKNRQLFLSTFCVHRRLLRIFNPCHQRLLNFKSLVKINNTLPDKHKQVAFYCCDDYLASE